MKIDPKSLWNTAKSLVVPTIAAFLSFVFVVVRPWSDLCGEYAFLSYTTLIIFFFPNPSVVAQLETTLLGIIGSALGLAWSIATLAIAASAGRSLGADSEPSNAIIGIGLALLSLVCGFIRSYAPRFTAASRIALFFPIFLLTANTGITEVRAELFTEQFLVTCFAAAFSLIPVLAFSRGSSSGQKLGKSISDSLQVVSDLLPISLSSVLGIDLIDKLQALETNQSGAQDRLSSSLKRTIASLDPISHSYKLEFTLSRIKPSALDPLLSLLRHIRRNPLLGQTSHVPGERIQHALKRTYGNLGGYDTPSTPTGRSSSRTRVGDGSSLELKRESLPATPIMDGVSRMSREHRRGNERRHSSHSRGISATRLPPERLDVVKSSQTLVAAIQQSTKRVSIELSVLCTWPSSSEHQQEVEKDRSLIDVKEELEAALARLAKDLSSLLDSLSAHATKGAMPVDDLRIHRDHFRLAFYMTALLDLAKDIIGLMEIVTDLSSKAPPLKRWYFPQIPGLSRFSRDTGSPRPTQPDTGEAGSTALDEDIVRQDEEDFVYNEMDFATASMFRAQSTPTLARTFPERIMRLWRRFWDHKRVVTGRIALSKTLRSAKNSPHVFFAIKLAGGISLLALPAYLSPRSRGRRYFDHYRGAWAVVSYMFVLETHTGAIFKIGLFRCLGTLIGAVGAYVCSVIAQDNPYALVVLGTALAVPISYLVLKSNYPAIGTVAGITLPPVLFISYLGLLDGETRFQVAWTRFVEINIGIVAAVVIGSLVWPNHARVRYFRTVGLTFERATEYYLRMSRDLVRPSLIYKGNTKEYNRLERELRLHIATSRTLIDIQKKEVSLLPRPIKLYSEVVDAVDRLITSFAEVRLLRFSVPRKTAVFDVMPLRRELISAILINLWALNQSFRSRIPLPQFLPSPRVSLDGIMAYMDSLARSQPSSEEGDQSGQGRDSLGILYGMAENEALGEVCTVLEELVAAAGTLFGTRSFVGRPRDDAPISM